MTAPTHVAFGVAAGLLFGAPDYAVKLLAAGALLPDIDHPQSAIGRVFFFLSYPLNKVFGHRRHIHSILLWLPATVIGFMFYKPAGWIGMGAISHCLIDCLNTSGVALMLPITEKIFVLGSRKFRIPTASKNEFVLMMVFGMVAWGGGYIGSKGGVRAIFDALIGSYDMARQYYEMEGSAICLMSGRFRKNSGEITDGTWLIVGTEGQNGLALFDEEAEKVIHVPEDGKFLKARLKTTEEKWQMVKLKEPGEVEECGSMIFYRAGKKWNKAGKGSTVFGHVIHQGGLTLRNAL